MPGRPRPAVLSYENLRRLAARFLEAYHPPATIPVPIEEIVEFRFKIDIVPFPELQAAFEVDGFISSDLRTVYVDEFVWEQRPGRYHFTLAHELAHVVLHRRIYQANQFQTVE